LSNGFTDDVNDVVQLGELLKCRILKIDPALYQVSLSMRFPRLGNIEAIPLVFEAKVTRFLPNSSTVVTIPCLAREALILNDSQLSSFFRDRQFWRPEEVLSIGQNVKVKIVDLDMEKNKKLLHVQLISEIYSSSPMINHAVEPLILELLKTLRPSRFNELPTCFHSKKSFRQDVLGVPLNLEYYESGEISYIHPHLDLLSYEAFEDGVRRSVSRAPFTHWMPLYFDAQHG